MRRGIASLLVVLALAPSVASHAGVTDEAWRQIADAALMPALRSAYPAVSDWSVEPLIGRRQVATLQTASIPQAAVLHVGKRSAVRLTWQEGKSRKTALLWFDVAGTQPVVTATSDVKALTPLAPELAQPVSRDVLALSCTPVEAPAALTGMRSKRSLQAGDAICEDAIEPQPAVGRGQHVTVVSTVGAVTVTAKGIAQQDARLGQPLRVKNPSSGEVYVAAASGPGEVTVNE
jgi:flagella basal body P-ring formation protein FlgA